MFFPRILVCLSLACAACVAQTPNASLDDVVSKYYKAIGGADAIKAISSCIITGKQVSSDGSWKKKSVIMLKQNKLRFEMDIQAGLKMIQAYDGTIGWNIMPWTGSLDPQPLNAENTKSLALRAELLQNDLITYRDKQTTLTLNGTDEIDGSDCYKVVAKRRDGVTNEYYLDVDSYLIVKIVAKYRIEDNDQESENYYSNYKQVNGIMMPFASESKNGGGFYIESFMFNTAIDDALFSMPKKG